MGQIRCISSRSGPYRLRAALLPHTILGLFFIIPGCRFGTQLDFSHFTDEEKKDSWVRIVAPAGSPNVSEAREASGPAPVHSHLSLYATLLSPSSALPHTFPTEGDEPLRKVYVHIVQRSGYNTGEASGARVKLVGGDTEVELREGDGAYIMGEAGNEMKVENVGDRLAEVLLFDIE